jgi:DNA mismatch repair ATPase MutL
VFLHFQIDTTSYDVNVSPNKRKLMFHKEGILRKVLEEILVANFPAVARPSIQLNDEDEEIELLKKPSDSSKLDTTMDDVDATIDLTATKDDIKSSKQEVEETPLKRKNEDTQGTNSNQQQTGKSPKEHKMAPLEIDLAKLETTMNTHMDYIEAAKKSLFLSKKEASSSQEALELNTKDLSFFRIVGKLDRNINGSFIVQFKQNLFLMDHRKALETVEFLSLCNTKELTKQNLLVPQQIPLSEFQQYMNMVFPQLKGGGHVASAEATVYAPSATVQKKLLLNGFDIRAKFPANSVKPSIEVLSFPKEVKDVGVVDVVEIVNLLAEDPNHPYPRSKSIANYFLEQSTEAVKKAVTANFSVEDAKNLLDSMAQFPNESFKTCPHDRKIFHVLW